MKTLCYLLTAALLFIVCLTSCKKDSAPQSNLIGKWNLLYIKSKVTTYYGRVDSVTAYATNGDYLNFRSDGKVYSNNWLRVLLSSGNKITVNNVHSYDTASYQMISNKLMRINLVYHNDTIQINQLNSNQLTIEINYEMIKDSIPVNPNNFIIWDTRYYYSK